MSELTKHESIHYYYYIKWVQKNIVTMIAKLSKRSLTLIKLLKLAARGKKYLLLYGESKKGSKKDYFG